MDRLVIVPDETFEPLVLSLKARLSALTSEIRAENIVALIGDHTRLLPTIARVDAGQELVLWAPSARAFLAAWTSRMRTEEITGTDTADLSEGLVSQVFASADSALQTGVEMQANAWTNLHETRGERIDGMAGSAVFIFGKCAAVLALVAYRTNRDAPPLIRENLARVAEAASLLGRLLEDRLIRASLGIELL